MRNCSDALPLILISVASVWSPICGADNSFRMTAIFSDQAGFFQYIQLQESSGLNNQHEFTGLTLEVTSRRGVVERFTFPSDLAAPLTAGRPVMIGTTFGPQVDFTLPPGFLPTDGGTLVFAGRDVWDYGVLPANGYTVLLRDGTQTTNPSWFHGLVFQPFVGPPTGLLVGVDPVIEYYNKTLDHYFISSSQPDIDALDSGRTPGWERTGESFSAWIAPVRGFPVRIGSPPSVGPVCRLYLPPTVGDSHFFSASPAECNDTQAKHPDYLLETTAAFFASLPIPQTGECPYSQTAVYRLWNGRIDSNHRYTTSPAIRDLMLTQGYIAEGYGTDQVAMCVGGSIGGDEP